MFEGVGLGWVVYYTYLFTRAPHGPLALAGAHASGRAGQHFELFDSMLGKVKKSIHTIIVYTCSM